MTLYLVNLNHVEIPALQSIVNVAVDLVHGSFIPGFLTLSWLLRISYKSHLELCHSVNSPLKLEHLPEVPSIAKRHVRVHKMIVFCICCVICFNQVILFERVHVKLEFKLLLSEFRVIGNGLLDGHFKLLDWRYHIRRTHGYPNAETASQDDVELVSDIAKVDHELVGIKLLVL